MNQPARNFDPNGCPQCGGELDYESGDPGAPDEPASVGVTRCTECDYERPDPDRFERLTEQADERNDAEWLSEHEWDKRLKEAD